MLNDTLSQSIHDVIFEAAGGATLTVQGARVRAASGDVVTVYSRNVEPRDVHLDREIRAFVDEWARFAATTPGIYFGVFRLPAGNYSLDVNILRPVAKRANSLAFARWNGQHSIYSFSEDEVIKTGLTGAAESRIKTPADAVALVRDLRTLDTSKLGAAIAAA